MKVPAQLRSIDALRGIAALGVVLYHAGRGTPVLSDGFIGVYLFFVISGFCIHLRWARAAAAGETPRIDFVRFWKRRLRRLYPAYLAALVLYLGVELALGKVHLGRALTLDVGLHLLMLHNFSSTSVYSLSGVFWTLALEEQLYLLYFVLLRLRHRCGWPATLALCFGARACWFAGCALVHRSTGIVVPVNESAASQWFVWALGAYGAEWVLQARPVPAARLPVGIALLSLVIAYKQLERHLDPHTLVAKVLWFFEHPLWGLAFFFIVVALVRRELLRPPLRHGRLERGLVGLGFISYSLYLTHELLVTLAVDGLWDRYHFSQAWVLALSLALVPMTVLLARGFFRLFERPFLSRARLSAAQAGSSLAGPPTERYISAP